MIAEFYKDKEIFITGGSGILGRGIIEKLLRSTEVKRIYMLLRDRKGVSAENRLKSFKEGLVFRRLRKENPNVLDKISSVPGDICQPLLGLSMESFEVIKNVQIFMHSAATVRFDEPFRKAIKMNVGGTYECVKVAKTMKSLEMFVHISTFYSNPFMKFTENILYSAPMDWKLAIKLADSEISDEDINPLTRKVLKNFPNTYTFTKNLSENVVNDHKHLFPVLITRPSIIIYSKDEPEPGYVETLYGIMGIVSAMGTGLLRSMYARRDTYLDLIYLDLVVKLHLLHIIRFKNNLKKESNNLEIAQMSAGPMDPYTLGKRMKWAVKALEHYPFVKCVWFPGITITSCLFYYRLRVIMYQVIPSIILDLLLRAFKIEPRVMAIQRRLYNGALEMKFFLSNTISSNGLSHMLELVEMSNGTDFEIEPVLYTQLTEDTAIRSYKECILSNRRYILREKDKTIPNAITQYKILKYLDILSKWTILFFVARYFYLTCSTVLEMDKVGEFY